MRADVYSGVPKVPIHQIKRDVERRVEVIPRNYEALVQNVRDAEDTLVRNDQKGTVLEAVEGLHIPVTLSKKIEV